MNATAGLAGHIAKSHMEGDVRVIDEFRLTSVSPPTDERAALAARHQPGDLRHSCNACGYLWPCDTARALALPPDPERLARLQADPIWRTFTDRQRAAIIAAWPKPEEAPGDDDRATDLCGHEDCDMEPCSGPIIRRDALWTEGGRDAAAEASTAGLAVGDWPARVRVADKFGRLLTFDRLHTSRDDDGDIRYVAYTYRERHTTVTLRIYND